MSVRADRRCGRERRCALRLAALAAGAAAALAGCRLVPSPPAPSMPAPVVPPAPVAAFESLGDIQRLFDGADRILALYLLAGRSDAAGVERLLDEAGAIEPHDERTAAMSVLYGRYANLDPAAALRHVQRQSDTYAAVAGRKVVFRAWARSDLAAALDSAETLDSGWRITIGDAIVQARDDLPPATRAEIAARLSPQGGLQRTVVHWEMDGSFADDPASAWRQALAQSTYESLAQAVAEASGPAELEQARYTLARRDDDLEVVAKLWARTDARAALDALASARAMDGRRRQHVGVQLIRAWARAEPAAAAEWALALPAPGAHPIWVGIALGAWAAIDPRAALNALQATDGIDAERRDSWREDVVGVWASTDQAAALDWATALPDPQARGRALDAALDAWIVADPRAVAAWLDSQPREVVGDYRPRELAVSYGRRHVEEAIAWAAARFATNGAQLMADVFFWLSYENPERATRLLAHVEDADARRAVERALVRTWAYKDPRAALAWLNRLADPDRRAALLPTLLARWGMRDFAAAMRQVDNLADSQTRRSVVLGMFRHALHPKHSSIPLAKKLLDHIEPEDARREAAAELDERLSEMDPIRAAFYR